tara:strand:- start:2335 stop:5397 length:3063 start_codon:yes stop_codon:yes gene_type:complete
MAGYYDDPRIRSGIAEAATELGMSPVDLGTLMSYETGGTLDPTQAGPTTQWGQHRGFIQFGEPQAQQYGVDWADPVGSQLGANGAVVRYMRDNGYENGMSLEQAYSTINAGGPNYGNRTDENNGGASGTVAEKVRNQMQGHRANAERLFGAAEGGTATGETLAYTPEQRDRQERLSNQSHMQDNAAPSGYGISDRIDDPMMMRLRELAGGGNGMGTPSMGMPVAGAATAPPAMGQEGQRPMPAQYGGDGQEPPQVPTMVMGGESSPTEGEPQAVDYAAMLGMPADPNKQAEYMVHSAIGMGVQPEEIESAITSVIGDVQPFVISAAEQASLSMGTPVSDAPQSVAQIAAAIAEPPPALDDNSPDAQASRRRMRVAGDMLQVLSVGLGQMSAGRGVDLSSVMNSVGNAQRAREEQRYEQEQAARAQQQQTQAAQSLAQQFRAAGQPQLANLALMGPDSYAAALGQAGDVFENGTAGGDYDPQQAYYNMSNEDKVALLRSAGATDEQLPVLMGDAGSGYDFIKGGADRITAADNERTSTATARASADPLIRAGVAMMTGAENTNLEAAIRAVDADPTDEPAKQNLRKLINNGGGDAPAAPMGEGQLASWVAQAGGVGNLVTQELVDLAKAGDVPAQQAIKQAALGGLEKGGERSGINRADTDTEQAVNADIANAAVAAGVLSPELGELAATAGLDVALTKANDDEEVFNLRAVARELAKSMPESANELRQVRSQDQLDAVLRAHIANNPALPSDIRTAQYMLDNPEVAEQLIRANAALSGKTLNAAQQAMFDNTMTEYVAEANKVSAARPLVQSMELVNGLVTAEGYDSGPITGQYFAPIQRMATDLFGTQAEGLLVEGDTLASLRFIQAAAGEHFGAFRATGSGATSDMESRLFLSAMPGIADSRIEQIGLSQSILRNAELNERSVALRQQWIIENTDNPDKQVDTADMNDWVDAQLIEQGVNDIFPEVTTTTEAGLNQVMADLASGNIAPDTLILADGQYKLAREVFSDEEMMTLMGGGN